MGTGGFTGNWGAQLARVLDCLRVQILEMSHTAFIFLAMARERYRQFFFRDLSHMCTQAGSKAAVFNSLNSLIIHVGEVQLGFPFISPTLIWCSINPFSTRLC